CIGLNTYPQNPSDIPGFRVEPDPSRANACRKTAAAIRYITPSRPLAYRFQNNSCANTGSRNQPVGFAQDSVAALFLNTLGFPESQVCAAAIARCATSHLLLFPDTAIGHRRCLHFIPNPWNYHYVESDKSRLSGRRPG
ncbi:hypothetical protein ACMZ49_21365, partial [Alcaligenes phenolicus]